MDQRPSLPLACRIESAVRDVFEKRLGSSIMAYDQARELVCLESEIVAELVFRLATPSAVHVPADCWPPAAPVVRHRVRGTVYTVLGQASLHTAESSPIVQGTQLTVYRGEDGVLWARPVSEFDSRFEVVP